MDRTLILFLLLSIVKQCATLQSEVYINDNITENIYSNGIVLSCSFNLRNGDKLVSNRLAAQNSTNGTFGYIAGVYANDNPFLTSFGERLFENITPVLDFEDYNNTLSLTFDNLTCRHERLYKCILRVQKRGNEQRIDSNITSISVTVHPTNPVIFMSSNDNNSTEPRNNNTDLSKNYKRTKRSTTLLSIKDTTEIAFKEGDNITFMCAGDVGRPKGKLSWQKIYSNESIYNYTNKSTETISELCSFEGNSTITIQVTYGDNQAIIRCIVESEVSTGKMYADSKPLQIHFKVRRPSIELLPNKTVFQEGDSVTLHCKTFGNPNPSYTWIKDNRSIETNADEDSFVIENANISDSGLYTCNTSNSIDGEVYSDYLSTYINIADKSTGPSSSTFSPLGSDSTKDLRIVVISCSVAAFIVLLVICIYKKSQTSSSKSSGYDITMTKTKEKNDQNKETDNEVVQQQKDIYVYVETKNRQIKDTDNEDNQQQEDTYADAQENVYDKPGDRRHKEQKNCEPFDHVGTAQNISAESNKPTESKDSTIMLNCNPKSHDKLKSSGYESVEMDGETPVLLSKSNGYEHADADFVKQHNEKYLQNQMEEDEKVNKSHMSHQPVEYAQVDETKKLKNKKKHNGTDQETVDTSANVHEGTKFESDEIHAKTDENADHFDVPKIRNLERNKPIESKESTIMLNCNPKSHEKLMSSGCESVDTNAESTGYEHTDADIGKQQDDTYLQNQMEEDEKMNKSKENSDEETKSSVKGNHIICNHNPTLEHDGVSSKDEKIKVAMVSPTIRSAGPPTEHKQNETTFLEKKDRINLSQTVDDDDEHCNTTRNIKSLASSEDNNQKENKNAETRQGINERSRRTVDNAEYFDTTTHLEKQQTKSVSETAIENDQTNSFINQAFDGEDNQEEDAVSAPIRLLDGLQEDEKSNQINDKQSKNDYENVESTAQPESSNGETFH